MSDVIAFPVTDDEPEWILDVREAEGGYAVAILRHGALVCSEWFRTYPEVDVAARVVHLTNDADVRVLLTPESEVSA